MANIFIVDDSKVAREIIKDILEEAAHNIVGEAANGEEFIDSYDIIKPDLVTVDYEMPQMNGLDASVKIIELDVDAKIIMITSVMNKHGILKALKAGVKEVLHKPIKKELLASSVNRVLGV